MTTTQHLKILVVGINYAPEHTGIGPYTTGVAEFLSARGHSVTVHTGIPHYPAWRVPKDYRWHLSQVELSSGVTVRRLRHFVPGTQDALRRGLYELTFAAQVYARGRSFRPDVVVAVVPSLLSAAVAARIAARHGARLVVWVQDLMSAATTQSGIQGGRYVAGFVARTEQRILDRATSVVVASDSFRDSVVRDGDSDDRVATIPNWSRVVPSTKDTAITRAEHGWNSNEVIVLHTGNMGLKQDLSRVVESAQLVERYGPAHVVFVLMGDGSQRRALEAECRGVANVRLADPVPDRDYSDVLAAADMLLINERLGLVDMSLPSKLTSYFASGRPVVGAVDRSSCTAREIERSRGGVVTDAQTPEAMLAAVLTLANDPDHAAELGSHGRHYAEAHLSSETSLNAFAQQVELSDHVRA